VLVPGVVGISIMFQGVQSVALQMAQEFGFTREIEDRVQAPCPIWLVAMSKVLSGRCRASSRRPSCSRSRRSCTPPGVSRPTSPALADHPHPRADRLRRDGRPRPGARHEFEPRNIGLMFGFVILPITFLGGTYYQWTRWRR
jgi:ABC-2 type transport system permease protein